MFRRKKRRYYVFDNATDEFIMENGELAIVSEDFVKEIKKDINLTFITFVRKEDYDKFYSLNREVEG